MLSFVTPRKIFLIIFPLLICLNSTFGETIHEQYLNALNEFSIQTKSLLQEKLNGIKANLINTTESKPRFKRSILNPARHKTDFQILKNVVINGEIEFPIVFAGAAFVRTSRNLYLIGAGKSNGSNTNVLNPIWIWDDETHNYQLLTTIETPGTIGVEGFVINDEAYFIHIVNPAKNLLDIRKRNSRLFKIIDKKIVFIQNFPTTGVSKWKSFEANGRTYLIQANVVQWKRLENRVYSKSIVPKTSRDVKIYKWTGVAFTKIAKLKASHSTSVDVVTHMGRTFIAVVNQTLKDTKVESTVLIYEMSQDRIKLAQKVTGWFVSDVHFIRKRNELYLAIAYNFRVEFKQIIHSLDSIILRLNGLFFVKYQKIPTNCALQWKTLRGPKDENLLHLQNSGLPDTIYQLTDGTWRPLPLHLPIQNNERLGIANLLHPEGSVVAIPKSGKIQFVDLVFTNQLPEELNSKSLRTCRKLLLRAEDLIQRSKQLQNSGKKVASKTRRQELSGIKHFKSVQIHNLKLEKMQFRNTRIHLKIINDRLIKTKKLISQLPQNLDGFLKKTQPQILTRPIIATYLTIDNLITTNLHLNIVHDRAFCEFLSKIIRPSTFVHPNLTREIRFDHVIYKDQLTLRGTLNTIEIPTGLVFLDKPNHFKAPQTFRHSITIGNDLKIKNTINTIKPEHILLTRRTQVIKSETHIYGQVFGHSIDVKGDVKIGGLSWTWFVNDVVRIDQEPIIIKGEKTISNDIFIIGDLKPEALVNGVNVERMFRKAISLDTKNLRFLHQLTFNRVDFTNLFVNGKLNGVSVPRDLILLEKSPWDVNLDFHLDLHLRKIIVNGLVNGLKMDGNHIMTRSGNQIINGVKSFDEISMDSNLNISGRVNNVDLIKLMRNVKSESIQVDEFYNHLTVNDLTVSGQIPTDLRRILFDTVKTNEDYKFEVDVIFTKSPVFQDNLDLPPVIFNHLIPTVSRGRQISLERKIFNQIVFEDNVIIRGTVNNLDVNTVLNNILTITGDQTIRNTKIFTNLIHVESDSFVAKKLNDIELKDAIRIDSNTKIEKEIIFAEPILIGEQITIDTTEIRQLLNGRSANEWFDDTLMTKGEQQINGLKMFLGVVNIGERRTEMKNIQVIGDVFLHKENLKELIEDVVLVDQTNVINNKTVFDVDVIIENLETKIVDNVNIIDLFTSALKLDEQRCIEINSEVTIQELKTKLVNDIDATVLENVALINDRKLPKNLHFHDVIAREIKLKGLLNTVKFGIDVITKDTQNKIIDINGPKTFEKLEITNLKVKGKINKIDLIDLNKTIVRQNTQQNITGIIKVDKLIVKNNIIINGFIAGLNLTRFLNQLWFIDQDITIKNIVQFHDVLYNPTNRRHLQIRGLLDEINLNIFNNVMTIDTEQEIKLPLTFKNKVIMNNIKIKDNLDLVETSLVNNINLLDWKENIIKLNEKQMITMPQTFTNKVIFNTLVVKGTMNDIRLDDVMKTRAEKQEISNVKVFNNVVVKNLEVEGLVMGVDIQLWKEKSLMINQVEDLVFLDNTRFESIILDDDAIFHKTINEIDLNSIVTIHGRQEIKDLKVFTKLIFPRFTHSLRINGTLNSVPPSFSGVVDQLLTNPLPYPCREEFVYFMYGCYRVLIGFAFCQSPAIEMMHFTEPEKEFLRKMKLIEGNFGWFIPETESRVKICYYKANLPITQEMTIIGKYTFANETMVIKGLQSSDFVTKLQRQFHEIDREYKGIRHELQMSVDKLDFLENQMCLKLNTYDNILKNAYRPLSPFQVIQTFEISVKRIIPLDLRMTNNKMTFLIVESHQITFYAWQFDEFTKIKNIPLIHPNNWLKLELTSYNDLKRESITLFLAHSDGCNENSIKSIQVLTLQLTPQWPNIDLHDVTNIPLGCTRATNVVTIVIHNEVYLISGIANEIIVWKVRQMEIFVRKTEPYDIYYVTVIDPNGMFAVASRYNGISLIAIYNLNVIERHLETKFEIYDLPKIHQIDAILHRNHYYMTFLTKTQIQLIEFSPHSNSKISKQIINVDCPLKLFWLTTEDLKWLFITSCGCNTRVFSFNGYLSELYKVERGIVAKSHVFERDNEIYLILQIKDCFENRDKLAILKAIKMGPTLGNECRLTCAAA